ncbi:hypothetical protein K0M31_013472 [Melipona bicolor]|uniref:Uncharacterized protein n=1 Tax=Melipona bicolor TaxID=60889 RepID=A0AA40KGA5_9HYME|nr:hypothetical protein K0M31_013472 [Melipona bicolor]
MEKSDCARGDRGNTGRTWQGGRRGGEWQEERVRAREGSDTKQDKNEGTIEQSHDWRRPSVRETA